MKKRGYYDVFVKTCAKYPSNIAIRYYDGDQYKHFTYSELYGICEYITQNLQQLQCNKGIIGVVSDRNIITPCVIAAAHKCSTTFMFLDPTQDIERIAKELNFTTVVTINNTDDTNREIFDIKPERTVAIFNMEINFYNCSFPKNSNGKHIPQHSFITMTSGSTGEPKHIQVPIRCLEPNIDDLTKMFNITSTDVIYFSTPLTFDPSMVEILLACINGASLLIAPEKIDIMFPLNRQNSITFWQTTPSKFLQFSNNDIMNKILCANSTLKILALGGEPLNSVKRLKELKSKENYTRIFNLYGVTEMSCWACVSELNVHAINNDKEIPLGDCLSETEVMVDINKINRNTGKIMLVSKTRTCYLLNKGMGNSEETSLKFVDTGDIGEIKSGIIYYRGRTDDIIKRFGHKVNLQMIESTVMQCPRVKTCVCLWLPKPLLLVIYFSSETFSSQELSDFLKCKLDDKCWPDNIIRVKSLPINKHGKLSKHDLCKTFEKTAAIPQTSESLRTYFLKELKVALNRSITYEQVKDKSFISVGGTSFLALSMCNRLSVTFPTLGNLILPYLVTHHNTIEKIIGIAEKELFSKDTKLKKCLKRSHASDSVLFNSSIVTKSPLLPIKLSNIEFKTVWTYDTGKCVDASPILFRSGLYTSETVIENSGATLLYWDRSIIITDRTVVAKTPDIVVLNRSKRLAMIVDKTFPHDENFVKAEKDKQMKYLDVAHEIVDMWDMDSAINCTDIGSHSGKIVVVDARSGELLGMIALKSRIEAPVLCLDGQDRPCGVVGAYNGVIVCFLLENVKIMWKINIESMIKSKAVCRDNQLYVASYDGQVRCINITNGVLINSIHICEQGISADLVLAKNKYVLVGSLLGICACIDTETNLVPWRACLSSPIFASPVVYDEEKYVMFAEVNGDIHCRTVEKGIKIWTYQGAKGNVFSSLCVKNIDKYRWQIVFGCHDRNVYSIYVKNYQPSLHWKIKVNSPVYSTPCTFGNECILAASNFGTLYIINSENGAIAAEHQLQNETFSSPAVFGEYIFIGCRDDSLHSIKCAMKDEQ